MKIEDVSGSQHTKIVCTSILDSHEAFELLPVYCHLFRIRINFFGVWLAVLGQPNIFGIRSVSSRAGEKL